MLLSALLHQQSCCLALPKVGETRLVPHVPSSSQAGKNYHHHHHHQYYYYYCYDDYYNNNILVVFIIIIISQSPCGPNLVTKYI